MSKWKMADQLNARHCENWRIISRAYQYIKEAQLQQRNSGSAAHVYLGWLTDLAMHNTAESQRLYYFLTFKRSDWRSAGRKWILTWNSHSRSFIYQSVTGRQGVAHRHSPYKYNTAGLISDEDSEEVATQIAKDCRRRQPHSHLTPLPRGTPTNIPINLIFLETRFIGLYFCRW